MNKILNIQQAINLAEELHKQNKSIVLAGGCFDILHVGHIRFLKEAKKQADCLFVLLESDETIRRSKGMHRPINNQKDRAYILSSLFNVDYVIMLPYLDTDKQYDYLMLKIKPDIIAATKGDPNRKHKERQVKALNAKIVDVIDNITNTSTSNLIKLLGEEYL